MDVIALYNYGFSNAVASLGTSFCEEHAKLLKRYTKNVVISFNSDEAGQNAVHKAAKILLDEGINVKVAILKGGKDPDEILKKYGQDYYGNILKSSKPYYEFLLDIEKENIDFDSMEGKINYAKQATAHLTRVIDPLERELYFKKLAKELDLSEDLIKNEYKKQIMSVKRSETRKLEIKENIKRNNIKNEDKILKNLTICEGELLNVVINNINYFNRLRDFLSNDYFNYPLYNKVFQIICSLKEEQGSFDINMIMDRLSNSEKSEIAQLKLKDLKYDINDNTIMELKSRISLLKNQVNISKSDNLNDLNEQIKKLRNRTNLN
jgi:DNA primase